ncbi:MAG: PCP reductase family protein [Acidimicrobiales bacterium]|mgnify:CR=1 FL=1|nr:PCP reductase family protein [Acidimicrobiales bacterium]
MKFLCLDCDDVMAFAERQIPGDGTLAAVFTCGSCGREMAMLTNPMETQLVSSMGVKIGGREVPAQPMELARTSLEGGRDDAFVLSEDIPLASGDTATPGEGGGAGEAAVGRVVWTSEATDRLERVPSFVRGMVKRIYTDWAREKGVSEITPDNMDRARTELGLEGM